MPTLKDAKDKVLSALRALGLDGEECLTQGNLIIEHTTNLTTSEQILHAQDQLPPDCLNAIDAIITDRQANIPLQYCLGYAYFGGLKLKVANGVFIPRGDTEALVNVALAKLPQTEPLKLAEVGVGSGAIIISLLLKLKNSTATGIDINAKAIELTRQNAQSYKVDTRLELICANFVDKLPHNLDALVSNPPYIPRWQKQHLPKEIADHEPPAALYGFDEDGLSFYRTLSQMAGSHLIKGGFIAVEIGDKQSADVCEIFERGNWRAIEVHEDLNKLPRVISAYR